MPYTTPSLDEIRTAILRDIQNLNKDADIGDDSDYYIRASSVASAAEGLYQHQTWITKQIFPDTADIDFLLMHAALRQMNLKPAVKSAGSVIVTGVAGTDIASGLTAKYQDGTQYVTTAGGKLDETGSLTVAASAVVAGAAGDLDDGVTLTLTVPPANINSTVTVVEMLGGADIETPAQLLARLLQRIRQPAAGGNKYDYYQWAMEVPGVTAAYVYPLRRGLGTVDVVVTTNGGLPSNETVSAVQAWIDDQRPVTAKNALVVKPTIKTYDVVTAIDRDGVTLDAATADIKAGLAAYDAAIAPGATAILSRIEGIVTDVSGVDDRSVTAPAANVVPVVDATKIEWCRLGNVTVTDSL
jgi:uncharacterized phage protein gp47/JayE